MALAIKNIYRLSATMGSGATSITKAIGASVVTAKSFIRVSYRGTTSQSNEYFLMSYFSDSSNVKFERIGTGSQIDIEFEVVEFTTASNISVQHISGSFTGTTGSPSIPTTVTKTKTWVLYSQKQNNGSWSNNEDVAYSINSGGTAVDLRRNGTTNTITFRLQVIEMDDITVQEISYSSSSATIDKTITSVDLTKSFAYASSRHINGAFQHVGRVYFTSATNVRFERYNGGQLLDGFIYVIEFNDDTVVDSVLDDFTGSEINITKTITSVDTDNTFIFHGSSAWFAQPGNSSGDDLGISGHAIDLQDSTTLHLQRNQSTKDARYNVWIISFASAIAISRDHGIGAGVSRGIGRGI